MAEPPHDLLRRGSRWRAPYAADPAASRGRIHPEPDDPLRSAFQRDRDRIVHCNTFRRLMHKTQVFIQHEGDHFRTRLTHTLEVAQIARSIARPLGLDEDLAETLALAHDLGHPPFGHAGERALNEALTVHEGFDHNAQSLRVVTALERRYTAFDGLNLTWETHEGLVKHNGPVLDADGHAAGPYAGGSVPRVIIAFRQKQDLALARFASLEAQVAAIADDIAYDCHDLEDGLRAELITLADLGDLSFVGPMLHAIRAEHPDLEPPRAVHELNRRMISAMIHDVLGETTRRIAASGVQGSDDVRDAAEPLVGFSLDMAKSEAALKRFLFDRVYRAEPVLLPARQAETLVTELFAAYLAEPDLMPEDWRRRFHTTEEPAARAYCVADYVAGMTDRYADAEHDRLFGQGADPGAR